MSGCIDTIRLAITKGTYNYICVTNVRTAYIANKNPGYLRIQNGSLMTLPDGMPLVWYAHRAGYKNVKRVSGLDLMISLFAISLNENYSHYFYGSTPATIEHLVKNISVSYPGIDIKKAVSPPFQPVEKINIKELVADINTLNPTFFWVGLGAPKQEFLMEKLQPLLKSTICVGVGLSFEYLAGTVKRAPLWAQKAGLEWVFRIAQQPRNFSRIILPFLWFFRVYFNALFTAKAQRR
ncbi:MAG: WecB/TagA/CpsF family glycosyltransferase [Bacteroidetes bacterium]|nr:WecB/TagA/CpsF family glycosyltransferase [Bacteroidota bacterium]